MDLLDVRSAADTAAFPTQTAHPGDHRRRDRILVSPGERRTAAARRGDTRPDIVRAVDAAALLRTARTRAGLSQRALAEAAGTSQSAVAAIESGRKQPTVATLDRLLRAAGTELVPATFEQAALLRRARRLEDVLHLAEALPFRREGGLRYPRLPT